MQIIQSIREKPLLMISVIAGALILFIIMVARENINNSNTGGAILGSVNGKQINQDDFNKRAKMIQEQYGQGGGGLESFYANEQAWNQMVEELLVKTETEKLGILVSDKEVSSLLLSNDPTNPLLQDPQFKDSLTGKLDIKKAQTQLTQMKSYKGEQRERVNSWLEMIKEGLYRYKYSSLITGSAYYPNWMQKSDINDNTSFAMVNYVMVPYTDISDSAIKVSEADVNEYVKAHPARFKVEENTRKISYIAISQKPSQKDSNLVYNELLNIRQGFINDSSASPAAFVSNSGSLIPYKDTFVQKSLLNPAITGDTNSGITIGKVYGPFIQNNSYLLAKVLQTKMVPDSAKARHILFQTADPRNPNNTSLMPEAQAKLMADSVFKMIQAGVSFDSLCKLYSYDLVSKEKGGDVGYFSATTMVSGFSNFCFNNPIGQKGVVKTEFGYHVIEVTGQKNPNTAYNIAYVAKEIVTTEETINATSDLAIKASESKDKQSLEAFAKKNNLNLISEPVGIKENDFMINSLPNQNSRDLVKWAFGATAGAISSSIPIGDQKIVAVLEKVIAKGSVMDAEMAKPMCEMQIKNTKKYSILKAKAPANSTLDAVAGIFNKSISITGTDSTLTFSSSAFNGANEPKVIGAAFNKNNINKVSQPIQGEAGLYYIQVTATGKRNTPSAFEIEQLSKDRIAQLRNALARWVEGLKKQAEIVDNRSQFY